MKFVLLTLFSTTLMAQDLKVCEVPCQCEMNETKIEKDFYVSGKTKILYQCLPNEIDEKMAGCLEELNKDDGSEPCDNDKYVPFFGSFTDCTQKTGSKIPHTYLASEKAPANCGYLWENFGSKVNYPAVMKQWLEEETIACKKSMCTSAAFLALARHAKKLYEANKISKEKFDILTDYGGRAWQLLNGSTEVHQLVEEFGIGKGYIQHEADGEIGTNGVPKPGDLFQIWRNGGSGHSTIFKGFLDSDNDGVNDQVCYWSSQGSTGGYKNMCEKISSINFVWIGSFHE